MEHLKLAVLCLLACTVFSISAKKPSKSKAQTVEVEVSGENVTFQLKETKGVYAFTSKDKWLKKNNYLEATVFYDYRKTQGVMVLVVGKKKEKTCFYKDTSMSLDSFKSFLDNPVRLSFRSLNIVRLDGRGDPKSGNDLKKWLRTMSFAKKYCKKAAVVELVSLDGNADLTDTENEKVFAISDDAQFVVAKKGTGGNGNGGNANSAGVTFVLQPRGDASVTVVKGDTSNKGKNTKTKKNNNKKTNDKTTSSKKSKVKKEKKTKTKKTKKTKKGTD